MGDMGFLAHYNQLVDMFARENMDSDRHRFIPGNHDDYDHLPEMALGDFGTAEHGGMGFFFVRGAYSIDWQHRTPGVSWWTEEELSHKQGRACLEAYSQAKPELVISHDCPLFAYGLLMSHHVEPSRTAQMLEAMHDIHAPKRWFFGHHHQSRTFTLKGTEFQCLNELESVEVF